MSVHPTSLHRNKKSGYNNAWPIAFYRMVEKMNRLVAKALLKPTIRKATLPTPASKEKRLDTKKRTSLNKILRKKINRDE
jgi:hypothetical protein